MCLLITSRVMLIIYLCAVLDLRLFKKKTACHQSLLTVITLFVYNVLWQLCLSKAAKKFKKPKRGRGRKQPRAGAQEPLAPIHRQLHPCARVTWLGRFPRVTARPTVKSHCPSVPKGGVRLPGNRNNQARSWLGLLRSASPRDELRGSFCEKLKAILLMKSPKLP